MSRSFSLHAQTGYSLVELMISMMLGLLLSTAIISVFFSVSRSYKVKSALETMQENSLLGLHFLSNDLQTAGFKGCFEGPFHNINIVSKGVVAKQLTYSTAIYGTSGSYQNSDVISFISSIGTVLDVSADMPTSHSSIDLLPGYSTLLNKELLITDCLQADLFTVTSVWKQRFSHDSTKNSDANLSATYLKGSLVYPLSLVSYKLAKGVGGNTGLFRKVGTANYQELIANVVQMKITYGVVEPNSFKLNYFSAANVVNFNQVISIKVQLLLSSAKAVLQQKMHYVNFENKTVLAPDLKLYKAYSIHLNVAQ
ncbi:PilW family protein [Gammaproteobacteria bacterium AS21]